MNLFAITSLLCAVFCFALAIFSLLAGRSLPYRLLMLFNLAVTLWGTGGFIIANASTEEIALIGWKIADLGGFFVGTIYYHLVCVICNLKGRKFFLIACYLQATVFNLLNFITPWVMNDCRMAFGFFYVKATFLLTLITFVYLFLVSLSYLELIKALKTTNGHDKLQIRYMVYGFAFGFLGGTTLLLPQFGVDIIYPLGNVGVFIYAGVLVYAVLREKILDYEEIVQAAHRDKLAAIGTLATSINHEVRNPLFVIQALAEAHLVNLKENVYESKEKAFEKSTEILEKAVVQSTRAMEIMKRFAIFAKQEVREEATPDEVNLNETCEMILPLVKHELEMEKIEFVKNIPGDLPPVRADRRHVEEILFNLIVNSCQAMKEQGVQGKIEVSAAQHNGSIHIKIGDNGQGIPSDKLQKIFEPFYTTKEEGTGLGLYITKQLVQKNGGEIEARSELGVGTVFTLKLKRYLCE